jgi:hypothetical protein
MSEDYQVKQGDCISSIAYEHGFFGETLWKHGGNASLKSKRKDPNVLMEGDVVHIPDKAEKLENGATEQKHRFRRKGVPAKLAVQFTFDGKARANVPFTLMIDDVSKDGKTDGDGWIRQPIPPNAREAKVLLKPKKSEPEEYVLQLGHLDPVDTISGQKARLENLGFFQGEVLPEPTSDYTAAIKGFQKVHGLNETGVADNDTQQKLKQEHQS